MKYYIVQYVLYIRIHQTTLDTNCIQMFSVPTICSLSPTPFLPVWPAVVLLAQPRAASLAAKSLAVQVVLVPTLFCIICEISKKKIMLHFETCSCCSPGISDTRPLHPSFSRKMWGCQRSKWFRLVFVRQFNDSKIYEDFRSDIQAHASLSDCLGNAQLHQILALSPQWRNAVQQLTCSLIVWSVAACLLQFVWLGWPVDLLLFHWLHGFHHLRRQTKNL